MKTTNDIISMIAEMYRDDRNKKFVTGQCVSCKQCPGLHNGCYSDMYVISICYVLGGEY